MDFGIPDDVEDLKKNKRFSDIPFFSKNIITFINFSTFEQSYLSTFPYNSLNFHNLGNFLLRHNNETRLLVEGIKTR